MDDKPYTTDKRNVGTTDKRAEREDRRTGYDRRMFPPRPEGRRVTDGRRASDPHEER